MMEVPIISKPDRSLCHERVNKYFGEKYRVNKTNAFFMGVGVSLLLFK